MKPYYEDAAVTLYLGDCRDILPQIEPVDHLMFDPPYSRDVYLRASAPRTKVGSGTPARLGTGALQRLAAGDIGVMDEEFMQVIGRWAADNVRRWAIAFSDVESVHLWRDAFEHVVTEDYAIHAGMRYVRTGVWVKPNPMPQMSGDRPAVGFEPCTICHALGPMRWNGGGKAAVWTYNISSGNERPEHPCPKPEGLMGELIAQFTDPGETVLDPFAGSGTTLLMAKRLGRKAIGIEVNEQFAEVAASRLSLRWMADGPLDLFGSGEVA